MKGSEVRSMPDKASRQPQRRARKVRSLSAEAAKADQYIADQLKAMYDAVTFEPVPHRLLDLLNRLDTDAEK